METEPKKIALVVDDDIDYLLQIKTQLENSGFNVLTAENFNEAQKILENTKPDIVLTDLMMDRYDEGFGLSNYVKKKYNDVPVILITNVTNELGMRFSLDTPEEQQWIKADAILNKPVRYEQLMKEINKLLK